MTPDEQKRLSEIEARRKRKPLLEVLNEVLFEELHPDYELAKPVWLKKQRQYIANNEELQDIKASAEADLEYLLALVQRLESVTP